MTKVIVFMTIAAASAAVGQICVRQGMQQVGPLESFASLTGYVGLALTNPYVVVGTVLNAVFYFLFLAALSWAEVTVVLPMTALEFGMAALLAVLVLHEAVPTLRWAGIALVILGVMLITLAGQESV